ncbi:MAG: peptidoglycan DD-metalloendopeptidase family protein [Muribaculaceae bacterium]|nr:peptidoglycan DD-metalloendopeptidase family protein [Muribaculaceae bacterium]
MKRLLIIILSFMVLGGMPDTAWAKKKATTTATKKAGSKTSSSKKQKTARSSSDVKKDQTRTTKEIKQTQTEIKRNSQQTELKLNELSKINGEISAQKRKIDDVNAHIEYTASVIDSLENAIADGEDKVKRLRHQYAISLRDQRRQRKKINSLNFIFSAQSFSDAMRRLNYLKQFDNWQTAKARDVRNEIKIQQERARQLNERRELLENSRADLRVAHTVLDNKRKQADNLVTELRKEGASLKKALTDKQQRLQQLNDELERVIAREQREAEERRKREAEERRKREAEERRKREAEEQRKKAGSSDSKTPAAKNQASESAAPAPAKTVPTGGYSAEAEADRRLTGSFAANKGKLLFPVSGRYTIVLPFGTNPHPDIPNVKINNSGIDIEVAPGTTARAVFDGEVSSVFRMAGYSNVVMIRHGEYLTVYAGLTSLKVAKGTKVKAGQVLGTVFSDPEDNNRTILHFELRKERTKLNPAQWVR